MAHLKRNCINCILSTTLGEEWGRGEAKGQKPGTIGQNAFSPSGIFGHLTRSAFVFIVGIYVMEGSLGTLRLLAFVIFESLYTCGDCLSFWER